MRVLIIPDSFKGTLSSLQAAQIIEESLREEGFSGQLTCLPLSDGGEGALEVLAYSLPHEYEEVEVRGPLGEPIKGRYLILGERAVIEMAQGAGLLLVPPSRRNPLAMTTWGVGELINSALQKGFSEVVVTLGGSGTNDGGVGMAEALGVQFFDGRGKRISFGETPWIPSLLKLDRIDFQGRQPLIQKRQIRGVTDVTSPLCGPQGASCLYGPQKGATPEMVELLDRSLEHLARVVERDMGISILSLPGAGAAGGLGGGLVAFAGASLGRGFQWISSLLDLEEKIKVSDLIITGEGRIDGQTLQGKILSQIGERAQKYGRDLIALGGSLGEGWEAFQNREGVMVIDGSEGEFIPEELLMAGAPERLKRATKKGYNLYKQRAGE